MKYLQAKLEIKSLSENGEIEGYAGVFDVKDLGNDILKRGSFTKTISKCNGALPIFLEHNPALEVGMTYQLWEDDYGVGFKGRLYIDNENPANEIPLARETYIRLKHRQAVGVPLGISFGYIPTRKKFVGGARELHEVDTFEITLTGLPMNPAATITQVKGGSEMALENKAFKEEYQRRNARKNVWLLIDVFTSVVWDALYQNKSVEEKQAEVQSILNDFVSEMQQWISTEMPVGFKSLEAGESTKPVVPAEAIVEAKSAIEKLQGFVASHEGRGKVDPSGTEPEVNNIPDLEIKGLQDLCSQIIEHCEKGERSGS
jgi:HK97 family phage prohead protease